MLNGTDRGILLWAEDSLVMGAGGLQSTMLEGHSTPLPSLDLLSIKSNWFLLAPRDRACNEDPALGSPFHQFDSLL